MTGASTTIGHNRRRAFHHRLPVRIGHVGHENIACLYALHFGWVVNHAHRACTNFLPNRAACGQHGDVGAFGFQSETLLGFARKFRLAFHRLRAGLQDIQFAVHAIFAPLNVHSTTIMRLDNHRIARQFTHILIVERVAIAHFQRHIHRFHTPFFTRLREFHLDEFATHRAANDGGLALFERGFEHIKLIGIDRTLHHGFAQTITRGDEHHLVKTTFSVHRKHHARGSQVRAHHALNTRRKCHFRMGKAFVHAIGNRTVVVERGKYVFDFIEHIVDA